MATFAAAWLNRSVAAESFDKPVLRVRVKTHN